MLLASPSVCFTNLIDYMNSLYKLQKLRSEEICLSHTTESDDFFVPAQGAIRRYIDYRLKSEKMFLSKIERKGHLAKTELFKEMYGDRDLSNPFEQGLIECNFHQQINKLV